MSLAVAALTTSCDLDAPSISTLDESSVYSVYGLAEQEIMSINVSFGETNSYRGRFLPYYGVNSDVETTSGSVPSASKATDDKQNLCNFATLSTNGQMNTDNNAYAKFYEGIERANLAIEGIKKYGNPKENKDMAQLLGEAMTMRAVIYNDLIKAWGDVPARFEPNSSDNVYLPRTNKDDIYKRLLNDLYEAETLCYWPNQSKITSTAERVNKAFVKGLRARLALYACGYSLRGDGYRRSTDPALSQDSLMPVVLAECSSIISNYRMSGKSDADVLGSFEDNFKRLCQDGKDGTLAPAAGLESLWEIPFSAGRGRVLYTWGVKHAAADQYTLQPQGGVNGPMPYLFYDYSKNDKRRDITCVPYQWSKNLDENGKAPQELRKISQWCFGKLRYEWMDRIVTSTNDDGVNWQYMRLADVYLMAAEAANYLHGAESGWIYMEPVLSRVLPKNEVDALKAKYVVNKETFLEGIIEQRGLEFAGEALRRADLVRWGIIDQKMAEAKQKLQDLSERKGAYADLPDKLYYKIYDETTDKDIIAQYGMYVGDGKSGEALVIYGLNHGDTDELSSELKALGFSNKGWFSSNGTPIINADYWDGLYVKQPSLNYLWPIWETFVGKSNNLINNDGNCGQL